MHSSSRFLRFAVVASLVIPAIVIVLAGTSQAQLRPPGGPKVGPKMPMGPGPMKMERVWTCGACNKEIGKGNAPPGTCPFCGVKIINGVDTPGTPNPQPQQPQPNGGNTMPTTPQPAPGVNNATPPSPVGAPAANPNEAPDRVTELPRPAERPAASSGPNILGIVFGAVIAFVGLVLLGFSSFCIVRNM